MVLDEGPNYDSIFSDFTGGVAGNLVDTIFLDGGEIETDKQVSSRSLRLRLKLETLRVRQRDRLSDVVQYPPKPGEQLHIVSASRFNFWTICPALIEWCGDYVDEVFVSTWTVNFSNVRELLDLLDVGKIGTSSWAVGSYFKKRETSIYAMLADGLLKRGGRIVAFENHSKVLLVSDKKNDNWYCVEGSANMTSNPRLEQFFIANSKELYDFHRAWFTEMLELTTRHAWKGKTSERI